MPVAGTLNDEKIMDSHTFISITAAIQQVHNITKEIIKLDPKNKDFYLANSREYVKKLRKLKTDALKEVQNVKGEDVRVATFLGGYNYLLAEFGIDVKAVLEPTHGSQISMASLQKMIEKIKKDKIDIIFGEKNYSDEYVTIIKNETGIELLHWVKNYNMEIGIIMVTAYGTVETAVQAIQDGAYNYFCLLYTSPSPRD